MELPAGAFNERARAVQPPHRANQSLTDWACNTATPQSRLFCNEEEKSDEGRMVILPEGCLTRKVIQKYMRKVQGPQGSLSINSVLAFTGLVMITMSQKLRVVVREAPARIA